MKVGVQAGMQLLVPLRHDPQRAGLLFDFDGTLAAIVTEPEKAEPFEGNVMALTALAKHYKRVGVISGRPLSFLEARLPHSIALHGLYGLEVLNRGRRTVHPSAGAWREVVDDVASLSAARGPEGMKVESKGLSLTLHFRSRPEIADEVRLWAERQAARSGLVCREARMSFELHPPIDADKGTVVRELAKGLSTLLFVGDDQGDLPAFDALDALERQGFCCIRVAVNSAEAPQPLVERADLVVEGPSGVAELLRQLLPQPT